MKKKNEKIFKQINLEKIFKQIILEKIFKQIFLTNQRCCYIAGPIVDLHTSCQQEKCKSWLAPTLIGLEQSTRAVLMAECTLTSVFILTREVTAVSSAGSSNCPHKALTIDSRYSQVITLPLTSDQKLYRTSK